VGISEEKKQETFVAFSEALPALSATRDVPLGQLPLFYEEAGMMCFSMPAAAASMPLPMLTSGFVDETEATAALGQKTTNSSAARTVLDVLDPSLDFFLNPL
jgi:hypothetical protein